MYRFNKTTRKVIVNCKRCNSEVSFHLPIDVIKNKTDFPYPFRYIHGEPIHSLTLYLDKQEKIRGVEYSDSLAISKDIIDTFVNSSISTESESSILVRTIMSSFTMIVGLLTDDEKSAEIMFNVGLVLGETYSHFFKADDERELFSKISEFWKRNNLGRIEDLEIIDDNLSAFKVYDCYECSQYGNIGRIVCKVDEGFFKSLFELKFEKYYFEATELECKATGSDYCKFELKRKLKEEKIEEIEPITTIVSQN